MSSVALTAGIAELLSLEVQQRQQALNSLSYLRTEAHAPPIQAPVRNGTSFLGYAEESPKAAQHLTAASAWLQAATEELHIKGPQADALADLRRGSVASTRAGSSAAESEYNDLWSEVASEVSGLSSRRASALGPVGGFPPGLVDHSKSGLEPPRTTLKLSNIPRRCGKEELLAATEAVGFGDAYDFFYLPLGPQSKKNHGYAFINFKNNETADRFRNAFVGYPIRAKLLDVVPAPLQGLNQNIEHFSKTRATKCGWVPNVILKV